MSKRVQQLSDTLQTTCPKCGSIFMISTDHLEAARGQVRCGECLQVFNALLSIENFTGEFNLVTPATHTHYQQTENQHETEVSQLKEKDNPVEPAVSLDQAMYGDGYKTSSNFKPLLWMTGILLLVMLIIVQTVYYQRYSLISSPHFEKQILNLCRILPCDESRFTNLSQIKLLERNIFTHPTRKKALMVSGSFVNRASFSQPVPDLLLSLSDASGKFIASRLFKAKEFLSDKSIHLLKPGKPVQFRLEIEDPGTEALAYEFEFFEKQPGV